MGMKSTIVLLEDAISFLHSYMHDMAGKDRLWFEMVQKLQHTGAKEQFLQIVMQGSMVWLFLLSVNNCLSNVGQATHLTDFYWTR